MNNVLKHFIRDEWSNSRTGRCKQCGRDLYNPDAEFCTPHCQNVYEELHK